MMRFPILDDAPVRKLLAALDGGGEETRLVGGVVRNLLLGIPVTDIDCATTALPQETIRRAGRAGFRTAPTGIEHGTVTVVVDGLPFEVTTLREDVETDGRRAVVRFGRSFEQDARRRDFTINGLSLSADGRLHDTVGGLDDIKARRVRFIGDPGERIREDFLRILRFFRFHAVYGAGDLDAAGLAACIRGRAGLDRLSHERIRVEMLKLCAAPRAAETLAVMAEAGIADRILGGVVSLARVAILAGGAPRPGGLLVLAALAVEIEEDVQRLRERLRLSNEDTDRLAALAQVATAMRAATFVPPPLALRLWRFGAGRDAIHFARALALAAGHADVTAYDAAEAWEPPPVPWSGRDAVAAGLPPGPAIGEVLRRAFAIWSAEAFPTDPDRTRAILAEAIGATEPLPRRRG